METKEAFEKLINTPNWHVKCNVKASTARSLRMNFKRNLVTNDKMRQLLLAAGYKNKPEIWKVK